MAFVTPFVQEGTLRPRHGDRQKFFTCSTHNASCMVERTHALRLLCKFPFFQAILREIAQLFPDHTWIYFWKRSIKSMPASIAVTAAPPAIHKSGATKEAANGRRSSKGGWHLFCGGSGNLCSEHGIKSSVDLKGQQRWYSRAL